MKGQLQMSNTTIESTNILNDLSHLDSYIDSVMVKEFTPNMLFVLCDSYGADVKCVYQNPYEIVRDFWKSHTEWIGDNQGYHDSLAYLYGKTNELHYAFAGRKFQQILESPNNATLNDMNQAAFLFLMQHSVIHPHLLFGYVLIPEQVQMLGEMFFNAGFINIDDLIQRVLNATDDAICATVNATVAQKTFI